MEADGGRASWLGLQWVVREEEEGEEMPEWCTALGQLQGPPQRGAAVTAADISVGLRYLHALPAVQYSPSFYLIVLIYL